MTERATYWSTHLAAIEREGITTRAYADREGLSVAALYHWRRELKERVRAPNAGSGGFVAVTVPVEVSAKSEPAARCRIQVRNGVIMEFSAMPPAEWVAALSASLAGVR